MELRLLGPVEVVGTEGVVDLGGSRPTRLLVALATANQNRLTLDQLVDRCFDADDQPGDPVSAIRTAVRRVRRALGDDAIITKSGGYALDMSSFEPDIASFDELIAAGRATSDPVAAQSRFHQALDLWRGEPFGDLGDLDWLTPERTRLVELHLVALEGWHDAHLRNGSATEIIPSLEAVAAEHPLRERFHRQLMHALYLAERQPDALRVFQDFRSQMIEAGLDPSNEAVELEQRIAIDDPSLRATTNTRQLRGYQIEERLGEGAFSIVYRGVQPSVGRTVAIKQIRAELANRAEFIRRFETEAHLIARLEHPYIVPLYDYWREPGSAYLVMRYLRGGNLESRLHDGRWDLDKTMAMVRQIGDALATAHRAGVVHRDVKPANILLDEDGNAYLADFGIALEAAEAADPDAALSAGSPAYASPEQLQRLPVGPSADVHGLAIATYEALTAQLPFPDEPNKAAMLQRQLHDPIPPIRNVRPDLPAAIDAVLAMATAKSPHDRYQSIEEFVAAIDEAATGDPVASASPSRRTMIGAEERNPYKGLRAFDEADAGDFTGRERLVDQLVETLDASRLVAVVGPSGSGKSSVVRAGLLPALRRGRVPGSATWYVTTLIPGPRPFEELETALMRIAAEQPPDLYNVLTSGERGIARGVRNALPEEDAHVLLVIDQFEELFTLAPPDESSAFLEALASAVTEDRSRLRVVLTLRADFYDRPLRHDAIGRLVRDATVAVLPLAPDELEHAIVDPAHAVGAEFEPGLVAEIAADVADQPGALPLLQYALTELYELRQSGMMTRDAYRKLGGVAGALARRAEDLYERANGPEQTAIRRIFGRLVSLGEGTEDTRRRALRAELGDDAATAVVIDRYGTARLFSFDRDPATREPTLEVAHEALLREWPRLREWLDEDRESLRILRHLHTTANEWDTAGRPESELYRGGRLEGAEDLAASSPKDLRPLERDFVAAGVTRREAEAHAERRSNRRLRRLLEVVGVVAVIALVAGVFAFVQQGRADENASRAETERIAAEAAAFAGEDVPLSLLLAVEAHRRDSGPVGLGALQTALARSGSFLGFVPAQGAGAVHWIDRDTLLATGSIGASLVDWRTAEITELSDRPVLQQIRQFGDGHTRLVTVATVGGDLYAFAPVDDPSLVELVGLDGSHRGRIRATSAVDSIEVANDGTTFVLDVAGWLIATEANGTERWRVLAHPEATAEDFEMLDGRPDRLIDTISGERRPAAEVRNMFNLSSVNRRPQVLALSPDGSAIGSAESFALRLWATVDGALQGSVFSAPLVPESAARWEAEAEHFAFGDDGRTFSAIHRHLLFTGSFTSGEVGPINAVDTTGAFGGGPKLSYVLATEAERSLLLMTDGRIVWADNETGTVDVLVGSTASAPTHAALSTDGELIAAATPEGIGVMSATGSGVIATGIPREGMHGGALLRSDLVTTSSNRFTFEDWNPGPWWDISESPPVRIEPPFDEETPERFTGADADGYVGGTTFGFEFSLRDPNTYELLTVFEMPLSWSAHDVRSDLGLGAFGTAPGLTIYQFPSGVPVVELEEPGAYAASMSFTPDGAKFAAAGLGGELHVYDTSTWEPLEFDGLSGTEHVRAMAYHPDGTRLITLEHTGDLVIRNAETFEPTARLAGSSEPLITDSKTFLFDDTGRYLLTSGDGSAILWDLEQEATVGVPFPNDPDFRIGGRDGLQLLTAVGDWMKLWNLDLESWPDIACQAAGRNVTLAEWAQFGPAGEPYRATCPQWPAAEERD